MHRVLFVILFFSTPFLLAQKAKIIWSATTSINLSTSKKQSENQRTKKIIYRAREANQADLFDVDETSIGEQIFVAFLEGQMQGYHSASLKKVISTEEIASMYEITDTVTVIDPINYEITYEVLTRAPNPADFTGIRLHLGLVLYDDGTLRQNILAATLYQEGDGDDFVYIYFKPEQLAKSIRLNNPDWNILNRTQFDIPLTDLATQESSPNSTEDALRFMDRLMTKTGGKNFRNVLDWSSLSPREVPSMFTQIDTVVIVDPISYKLSYKTSKNDLFYHRVNAIRLHQFWAWDGNAKQFLVSPIGYTPLTLAYDEDQTYLYTTPLLNWAHPWYRKQ